MEEEYDKCKDCPFVNTNCPGGVWCTKCTNTWD